MAWYNTYRPTEFSQVIGQDLVKSVLENALQKKKVKHAYLLSGSRGIGKTTLARIFAHKLNHTEQNPQAKIDIVELDAASHSKVEYIREMIENAQTPPMAGEYKVYIIDEVHMLSKAAMNSLLKILEEPPKYLVFLLATTNPEKLLPTVTSRLTKLNLHNHTDQEIVQHLQQIASEEGLDIDEESLKIIAKRAQGSQRDAINLLETVASYELDSYTAKETAEILGLVTNEFLELTAKQLSQGLSQEFLGQARASSLDGKSFLGQLLDYLLDQELQGEKRYSHLIWSVAKVLDLQLPVNTVVTSLALVQNQLSQDGSDEGNNSGSNSPSPSSPKSRYPEGYVRESSFSYERESGSGTSKTSAESPVNEPNFEQTETTPAAEVQSTFSSQDEPHTSSGEAVTEGSTSSTEESQLETGESTSTTATTEATESQTGTPSSSTLNDSTFNRFLKQLSQRSDAPPMLKMMIQDLEGEVVSEEKILLTVSNGVFLGQLKSEKFKKFVHQKLQENFGWSGQIQADKRDHKSSSQKTETATDSSVVTSSEDSASQVVDNSGSAQAEPEPGTPPSNIESEVESKDFYVVYKRKPGNLEETNISVIHEVPKPESSGIQKQANNSSGETDNWEQAAEEMFEFED
jgi:DNA polymerase III subunit gamma/tau